MPNFYAVFLAAACAKYTAEPGGSVRCVCGREYNAILCLWTVLMHSRCNGSVRINVILSLLLRVLMIYCPAFFSRSTVLGRYWPGHAQQTFPSRTQVTPFHLVSVTF